MFVHIQKLLSSTHYPVISLGSAEGTFECLKDNLAPKDFLRIKNYRRGKNREELKGKEPKEKKELTRVMCIYIFPIISVIIVYYKYILLKSILIVIKKKNYRIAYPVC